MKAIIYARCSTEEQTDRHGGVSIENQIARCQAYCTEKGFDVVRTVVDEGISGAVNRKRPGFMGLIDSAASREFDVLVVNDADRLSRDMMVLLMVDWMLYREKIELHTAAGCIDTSEPMGFMTFAMKAFMGEMERRQISWRTKQALQYKKSQGKIVGQLPYGYTRDGNDLVENPEEQKVLEVINRLYREGARLSAIVRHLNENGMPGRNSNPWNASRVRLLIDGYQGKWTSSAGSVADLVKQLFVMRDKD